MAVAAFTLDLRQMFSHDILQRGLSDAYQGLHSAPEMAAAAAETARFAVQKSEAPNSRVLSRA